ncbi:ABC transporter permease subunit [Allobranchiibius sp. GilTou38]|uniref:ABC transporter permease n=1 Tax=Allobranchiibius sp. GilTou38 TaxID=2815210 RepID=UPI001AA116DB|nr:ABC transporter permease subunit [Allobranchiibius sp. GilTou38]MBO1767839.1 ABC transporter permease subunit [Allobranchiibius sp. GilTou38]
MNSAILRLGVRSLVGRARVYLMLVLPVLLVLLALLLRSLAGADFGPGDKIGFLKVFGVGVVVPIVALIATSTLISSELDDGSIIYLLSKPVPRIAIVASKAVVILAAVVLFAAVPLGLAGLILAGGSDRIALGAFVGALLSGTAYVGIFIVLATLLKRSVVGALVYWLVWESTLSSLIGPVKWLSARAWGSSVIDSISTVSSDAKGVPWWYAVLTMLIAVSAGVFLAGRRLSSMTLSDE